jgi:hypothetical protein
MKTTFVLLLIFTLRCPLQSQELRPPAVPLVVHNPYFSVWSMADHLTDEVTEHWTGVPQSLVSLVRIDDKPYRIMGGPYRMGGNRPGGVPVLEQRSVQVLPTRTIYEFSGAGMRLQLTFMTPALAYNLELLARPVTYITWSAQSEDGKPHKVEIYFSVSAQLAVNATYQEVNASRLKFSGQSALRIGTTEQPVLQKKGDRLRVDWGYLYALPDSETGATDAISDDRRAQRQFMNSGAIPEIDDFELPKEAGDRGGPALVFQFSLGQVSSTPVQRYVLLVYDELYSIQFLNQRLRPYWRRDGATISDLLSASLHDYSSLNVECSKFDDDLMADLRILGGDKYALLGALAYRQSLGAQTLAADYKGTPLFFPKENSSNGDISTVDVIFPDSPLLLLLNPRLAQASMTPVLDYVASGQWPFPWAPHDLGTYPIADGYHFPANVDMSSSRGVMPVEETANMILLADAIAKIDGNATYAEKYWSIFTTWAEYLRDHGPDPENQLASDDFAGRIGHSANLSVKAIVALGAYAQLCDDLGKKQEGATYRTIARKDAGQWMQMAADGDHYRLAFDQPGTWSQKYNLIWDHVLGLDVFPPEVAQKEVAFYLKNQNTFGIPLDSRASFTKLDWLLWSASMADSKADFEALVEPAYNFADQTPDRQPLGDLYDTKTGHRRGFEARSVVGGVFIRALTDKAIWDKWAARSHEPATPLPQTESGN